MSISNDIVTIGYLVVFTKGLLSLNKEYKDISLETEVTYDDILSSKYFNYFKDSENDRYVSNGLYIIENDLSSEFITKDKLGLYFIKINNIEITCDRTSLSPCGDSVELITYGHFNLMLRTINGEVSVRKLSYEVNPILRQNSEGSEFIIDKHNISIDANVGDNERSTVVTASYSYKSVLKNASLEIIQTTNELSDWIFENSTTDYIDISVDNSILPKSGGSSVVKVLRHFTKHYYKLDSCGNKSLTKDEDSNVEDVSKLCLYNITNKESFSRNVNVVTASKQDVGASKRHCIVSAEYDGCNASITIEQEEGGLLSYDYSLSFDDDSTFMVKLLDNSLETRLSIPIISLKNMYVDNEYISSIVSYDINFVRYDDWYDVSFDEYESSVNIVIRQNEDINISRETELEIYNANDITNRIKVLLKQPKNKCLKAEYEVLVSGERYFTYDTIKDSKIEFKPQIREVYENGYVNEYNSLKNGYRIVCEWESDNNEILVGSKLIMSDFNGSCIMRPKYYGGESPSEVHLYVTSYIVDSNNERVSESKCFNLKLKGNDLITYEYMFMFSNESLYKELIIDYGDEKEHVINLISKRKKYVNGIYNGVDEDVEFKYNIKYKNDDYYKFLITLNDDNICINGFDYINDVDVVNEIELIQDGNEENTITLSLKKLSKLTKLSKDIEITVNVHKDNIEDDIWCDDESILYITKLSDSEIIKEIHLNRFWLYPTIEDNSDMIYNGKLTLEIGEQYNFKVENVMVCNIVEDNIKSYSLDETYTIEEDDEGIDLFIEI